MVADWCTWYLSFVHAIGRVQRAYEGRIPVSVQIHLINGVGLSVIVQRETLLGISSRRGGGGRFLLSVRGKGQGRGGIEFGASRSQVGIFEAFAVGRMLAIGRVSTRIVRASTARGRIRSGRARRTSRSAARHGGMTLTTTSRVSTIFPFFRSLFFVGTRTRLG